MYNNSWGDPWSDNPNAPQIPYFVYMEEKAILVGAVLGAMFYGIVIVLFFQCMGALFSSANRSGWAIKWGLVAHATIMFSFVTIYNGINLNLLSVSFIDNREFPGSYIIPPGPVGYQLSILDKPITIVPTVISLLNNWFADALLLYRCCAIYSGNYWAIVFPGVMYLASLATGVAFVYQSSQRVHSLSNYIDITNFGISYYSIALSLNVLLTVMIVVRLLLHNRAMRKAMGNRTGYSGPYTSIIAMLTESCAIYSVTFFLFIVLWGAKNVVANVFYSILLQTQVIAPLLIVLRVAKQNTLTNGTTISGNTGPIQFRDQRKSTSGSATLTDRYSMGPMSPRGKTPAELGVAVETTVDLYRDD